MHLYWHILSLVQNIAVASGIFENHFGNINVFLWRLTTEKDVFVIIML